MQVKKFEARTMKEALQMVKVQLGPDAIILSAKDHQNSFGLVGQTSVEVTAAVSEETLRKKKFTESRLKQQDLDLLQNSSAKVQKQVIDQMVSKYIHGKEKTERSQLRYVDIMDSQPETQPKAQISTPKEEVQVLKSEIHQLRSTLNQFQKLPQSFVSNEPLFIEDKLLSSGLSAANISELVKLCRKALPPEKLQSKAAVEAWMARYLLGNIYICAAEQEAKVHYFVGPSGTGKTSSMIKFAAHKIVKENKRVALISTDYKKVGAFDQMRIFAQILNVPFVAVKNPEELGRVLQHLQQMDLVLIDGFGSSLREIDEISQSRAILNVDPNANRHLVLSCMARDSDLSEIGKRFQVLKCTDVIFTNLDQTSQHGSIYNFMKEHSMPLHSFGLGSRVPEDYEAATRERMLDLILKLSSTRKDQA